MSETICAGVWTNALDRTLIYMTSDYADYSKSVVEAVRAVANSAGYGLVCVTGRALEVDDDSRSELAVCNGIYRLSKRIDAAGVVCEAGMLGHRAGAGAVIRFLSDVHLPCVSLGLDVPDTPSVVVDDVPGMTRLMDHLVADPARRRFAFVRGVPQDMYSMERERIFRTVLQQHDRPIDEALFVAGNYDADQTYRVIEELLGGHRDIDAIVAANDAMALSAARAAMAAGLSIPGDIAVTGFDDVPDATRLSPALTTVRQPLVEMAEKGVARLLALIENPARGSGRSANVTGRVSRVASELVVRGSTGGAIAQAVGVAAVDTLGLYRRLGESMEGLKAPAEADLQAVACSLAKTIGGGCSSLADVMRTAAQRVNSADAHWWSNLCHQIETIGARLPAADVAARSPLIVAALAPVRERIWSLEMDREYKARRLERLRSRMQLQIGSSSGLTDILSAIDAWMEVYRPQRFFLVQYDRPGPEPDRNGRLISARVGEHKRTGPALDLQTDALLPNAYRAELERGLLVLNPIYAGVDHFGYLLIDPSELDLSQLDSVAHSIGNALRSRFLFTELARQADQLQRANSELSALANRDGLTGIANRLCFENRLREACENRAPFAVCFLDLDGFKPVNDRLGHEVGDELLCQVAQRLERVVASALGEFGFVARLGGDEFTLLLRADAPECAVRRVTADVLDALRQPFVTSGGSIRISVSIGGAIFPDHGADTSALLRQADGAMYAAKAAGKNSFVLCEPSM